LSFSFFVSTFCIPWFIGFYLPSDRGLSTKNQSCLISKNFTNFINDSVYNFFSNPIHIKWNAAKQSEFVESIFNNETAFAELDYIFSEQCEGNQAKEIVNRVVNKIYVTEYGTGNNKITELRTILQRESQNS
jgi:hypothetical protein